MGNGGPKTSLGAIGKAERPPNTKGLVAVSFEHTQNIHLRSNPIGSYFEISISS